MDRLERELEDEARIVRLSILDEPGRSLARQHGVMAVPTFLIFDGQGNLLERQVGFPDRDKIKLLVTAG